MLIGKWRIQAGRWPWQKGESWNSTARPMCRFGGGWRWKLGVDIGTGTILINLVWGFIRVDSNACRCMSYHRRTGQHADGCPLGNKKETL